MSQDLPEKPAETNPRNGSAPDSKPSMNHASEGLRFSAEDLQNPRVAVEALAHWDDLDPATLALLERHPVHGPRLSMLRSADRWLEEQAAIARHHRGRCPSAEQLYDFGRGPGYTPLSHAARLEIDRHLTRCRECEVLVESLLAPPPRPLEIVYEDSLRAVASDAHADEPHRNGAHEPRTAEPVATAPSGAHGSAHMPGSLHSSAHSGSAHGSAHSGSAHGSMNVPGTFSRSVPGTGHGRTSVPGATKLGLRRWVPLAAAASLLATAAVWSIVGTSHETALRFPTNALLRGATTDNLFFPRASILYATPELVKAWPALGERLTFEMRAQPKAQSYWIQVSENDGSAFGANKSLWKQPTRSATFVADRDLAPGHFTWEAWAVENGLDRNLGTRDFEVVADAAVTNKLLAIAGRAEPERSLEAVRILHESGFGTDARRIARGMKPTPERDAYLNQVPGR